LEFLMAVILKSEYNLMGEMRLEFLMAVILKSEYDGI